MLETRPSICRFCHSHCPILVDVEDGQPVRVSGDRDHPVYHGFTCPRGRSLPTQHTGPQRLLHSRKRTSRGEFEAVPHDRAIAEIAAKVQDLLDRYGPRSIALYIGTMAVPYPASAPMAMAWMDSIGSPMRFMPATIDKPAKAIAPALHGRWGAGAPSFSNADAWMIVGANPLVSKSIGAPPYNPAWHARNAVDRGLELIVIDPRRTETAKLASVHLQLRPGEDPTVLAGLVRAVLHEGLHDGDFVRENAIGLDSLRSAVEPFTPEYVEQRAGVARDQLLRAARLFARAPRAFAVAGTGPNMSPRGLLSEYLLLCLNTLCGHWLREGDAVPNPGVLAPTLPPKAQPIAPSPGWGFGERLRVRGLTNTASGLPVSALADEILLDGEGRVRALICVGGNPLLAWPDQQRTVEAMRKLDLLVTLDVEMSATAKLSHYVIATRLSLEQPGCTLPLEAIGSYAYAMGYEVPYAQYTPRIVDPPRDSDVIEEWELFLGLAREMGRKLVLASAFPWIHPQGEPVRTELDPAHPPTTDELLAMLTSGSRIPLEEVKRHPHGAVFPDPSIRVQPKDADCTAKLELADETLLAELEEVARECVAAPPDLPFRLICRRMADVYNSTGRAIPKLLRKHPYNPAFLHPEDLRALGAAPGDVLAIRSSHGSILGVAEIDAGLRRGVLSMTHAFGDVPEDRTDTLVRQIGSNTNRLIPVDRDYDPHSGIPRMSALPVQVCLYEGAVPE